jgi:hypothetical protein
MYAKLEPKQSTVNLDGPFHHLKDIKQIEYYNFGPKNY